MSSNTKKPQRSEFDEAALFFHSHPMPGKLEIQATKPLGNQRDLALAYSPGVAAPCMAIHDDPSTAADYTARANLVAVVSNGSAVLGLGNIGPLASKPVMEGKAVLFKKFAGIDVFDIEIDAPEIDRMVETVAALEPTFGGINLEDIKAPECFEIERALIEQCDIPVFHDDQHGTAIVTAAGMLNALEIAGKTLEQAKIVCLGAGAAATSCMKLLVSMGAKIENIFMIDRKGVIHAGRDDLNQYKAVFAHETDKRTLDDALEGADVFVGLSGANLLSPEGLKRMAANPVVFACSNPDPEISPELAHATRSDVIMATGRSDYPNQVNNVLGFPFIFRGALDVRAKRINEEMKIAAAIALRDLAKLPVPAEVAAAYGVDSLEFGREYIIPKPMDPRLITLVSDAVAKAAIESGVATLPYPSHYPLQSVHDVFNG